MKLLYCIPSLSYPGGMERVLVTKVNYLVTNLDYDVTIVTTEKKGGKSFFTLNSKVRVISLNLNFNQKYSNLFLKFFTYFKLFKKYKKELKGILKQFSPDYCISLGGKEIEFLTKLNDNSIKLLELHFAQNNRLQFLEAKYPNSKFWKFIGQIRTKQLINSAKQFKRVVVLTKQDYKKWSLTNNNIVQIYNPSPLQLDKIAKLDSHHFIAVGKLDPQKGFDLLIPIWNGIRKKHPDWKLWIFGQGISKTMLSNLILKYNLSDNVFLKGVSYNIADEYLNSAGILMTSRFEGFPMVLIEAIKCGLPIIAFDCETGPREIVADGENGYLIEYGNSDLFEQKINFLIENEDERRRMGLKSKNISEMFSMNSIMKQWISLFNTLK